MVASRPSARHAVEHLQLAGEHGLGSHHGLDGSAERESQLIHGSEIVGMNHGHGHTPAGHGVERDRLELVGLPRAQALEQPLIYACEVLIERGRNPEEYPQGHRKLIRGEQPFFEQTGRKLFVFQGLIAGHRAQPCRREPAALKQYFRQPHRNTSLPVTPRIRTVVPKELVIPVRPILRQATQISGARASICPAPIMSRARRGNHAGISCTRRTRRWSFRRRSRNRSDGARRKRCASNRFRPWRSRDRPRAHPDPRSATG